MKTIHILSTLIILLFLWSCRSNDDEIADVYQSVRDINEVQLATATVTKIYTIRDPYYNDQENPSAKLDLIDRIERSLHVVEHTIKIGDRVGVYGLSCTYAAVINLNDLSPEDIKLETLNGVKHVSITLPPVKVRTLGNDFTTKVYHERNSGMRTAITESERTAMRKKASEQLSEEIGKQRKQDLAALQKAGEDKAIEFFTTMLKNLNYSPTITIRKS